MKVIFNYATRQFEPMEPTLRDRFMLGGRVGFAYGDKVEKVRKFILNKPSLTQKEITDYLKQIGYDNPSAAFAGLKKRGVFDNINIDTTRILPKNVLDMRDAVVEYNQLIEDGLSKKNLSGIPDLTTFYKNKTGKTFNISNYDYYMGTDNLPAPKYLKEARINLASDLIDEANATNKNISKQKIVDKLGLKRIPNTNVDSELFEIFNRYIPTEKKIQYYFDNMFKDFDLPADDVLSPKVKIAKVFNVNEKTVNKALNNYKNFIDLKPLVDRLNVPAFQKKIKGKGWRISDVDTAVQSGTIFKRTNAIENQLMDLAARHYKQGGDLIQFYEDGKPLRSLQNLTSYDNVTFKYRPNNKVPFGKKEYGLAGDITNPNYVDLQLGARKDPIFKEYFTQLDELDNLRSKEVRYPKGHPLAGKVTTFERLMKETYNLASGYSYKKFPYELDHFGGIKKDPFKNIQILPKRINQAAGTINFWVPEADKAKYLERINYKQTNLEDLIKSELKFAEDTLVFDKNGRWIGNRTIPLHAEAKEFFEKEAKKSLVDKVVEQEGTVEQSKTKGSKIKTALKAAKPVLKALPIIGTGIGLYDVNKALKAGITDPRDLYTAYEVSAEVAAKQKAIREDPTGKLGQQEITNLPDIGKELPDSDEVAGLLEESGSPYMQFLQGGGQLTPEEFNQLQSIPQSDRPLTGELDLPEMDQTMMAAQGGRVGFKDGSPNPMEEMATLKQAIASNRGSTELKDQFLYDTSPIGKLDKNIFGKDGDRNLMQQFNTQFLDPRSYPYYAQKTLRGAANIPELAVRFPLAAGYLFGKGSLALQTGDLSKFSMEDIKTAIEILEPKFTNLALEGKLGDVLGLSPEAIKDVEEKRTGPQKATGDLLQFGAEAVGPATPYFAIKGLQKGLQKIFPKLPKQIKDLVGTTSAVDKVNKEIERRVAQDGVDQTRRDIILATGAGGAVALLKLLGLDNLFKAAPKAVKATPEIVTKGGTPKYFFDFVNLIKSKGDDISEKAATLERQKVYNYNGYELTEDLSTGKISIRKDTEGSGSYYTGDGEYETVDGIIKKEEINYEPPETILDDKGKPKEVPDQYDESTLLPDAEGDLDDVEAGLDSIDDILDLLAKDGKSYTIKELEEMGLNVTPNSPLLKNYKPKKAGGGIIKLAGADSGPPPKSGPTPDGLPYIAKNVRPIKERK